MALSTFCFTKTISYCKSNNICSHIIQNLYREPVGGRNCFLGHGVTSGLLNRLLPLLFAVAAKSLGPGIWPLPVCSG